MRQAKVYMHGVYCGKLREMSRVLYEFEYDAHYNGPDISLVMPNQGNIYVSNKVV
jgi:HipA-like protein